MKNNVNFSYCYGCGVCATACPKNAITIKLNEDGFLKPFIDETCINCGICLKVCAFNHSEICIPNDKIVPYSAAAWSKDDNVRYTCTSGGAAYEIEKFLLSQGFNIVVVRYDISEHKAEHYIARTETELIESIGSKYIQSQTYNAFRSLVKNQKYLVVGTPCQIDSLRRFIRMNKMEDNFILMDFFCHGVPSMLMWDKYLKELEQKIGTINTITWRDKETGWHDSWVMKVEGKYSSWFSKGDLFYQMFLKDRCLGRACYTNCKYKYDKSAADIRIGDLWGRKYEKDENGVNGIICFTLSGENLLNELNTILHIEPVPLEVVGESQMKKCAHKPISYKYVMKHLKDATIPLSKIHKIASRIELLERIPQKVKYYIKRLPFKLLEIIKNNINNEN